MPTPVGHSMIGLALGLAYRLPPTDWAALFRQLRGCAGFLLFAVALSNAPDLDYLPGLFAGDWNAYHQGYTHSLLWVVLVTFGVWLAACAVGTRPTRGWLGFLFVALFSHLLADFLTMDRSAPYGALLFWPVDGNYYTSPVSVFGPVRKENLADALQWHNVRVIGLELLVTTPLLLVVLFWKCGFRAGRAAP